MKITKEAMLNYVEKTRYQVSSEFFSRGAAEQLKATFDKTQYQIIGNLKKEKEDKKPTTKPKKKISKFEVGLKVIMLTGLVVGGIALFKNLNKMFNERKEDVSGVIKELKLQIEESQVLQSVEVLETKIQTGLKSSFLTPLEDGIGAMTKTKEIDKLDNDLTKTWTESQKKHGVVGQVLFNTANAAIWYVFNKRGYASLLKFLNFPMPETQYFNLGMWLAFSDNTQQYMHVGRDLVNTTIKGVELVENKKNEIERYVTQTVDSIVKSLQSWENSVHNFDQVTNEILNQHIQASKMAHMGRRPNMPNIPHLIMRRGKQNVDTVYGQKKLGGSDLALKNVVKESDPYIFSKIVSGRKMHYNDEYDFLKDIPHYVEDQLLSLKDNDRETYDQYVKEWESILSYNFKEGASWDPETWLAKNRGVTVFLWTHHRINEMLSLLSGLIGLETYQALQSIDSTRALYQDFFEKQAISEFSNQISEAQKMERRKSKDYQVQYALGQISLQQYLDKMIDDVKIVSSEGALKYVMEDIKLDINQFQQLIPYGELKKSISDIKKQLYIIRFGGNSDNFLFINNDSLRENFNLSRVEGVDTNKHLSGRQFDRQEIKGSSEKIFSSSSEAKKLGILPYYYIALWDKQWRTGNPVAAQSVFGSNFYSWEKIPNGQTPRTYYDYDGGKWSFTTTRGEKETDGSKYNIRQGKKHFRSRGYNEYAGEYVQYYHETIADDYVGYRLKSRYETIDNGEIYLVDAWDYFDINHKYFTSEEISKVKSKKSHVSIYENEYKTDDGKLRELYNLPTEALIQNLRNANDYIEHEIEKQFEKRSKLIEDIMTLGDKVDNSDVVSLLINLNLK